MAEQTRRLTLRDIAAALFVLAGFLLASVAPSAEVAWVTAFLLLTIFLFAFEVVDVDIAAIVVMVLLGLTNLFASQMGLEQGLVPAEHLFDGFASNAVISIIAVMIVGAGLDKTGVMGQVAAFITRVGGTTEARIIPLISTTVGAISSFIQNVGATALFLPVVSRISARTGLPMSRLLMPMGFCAILGGTMTMVGSSPLILLNDLILNSNRSLPPGQQMETWSLFSVTPVGLALVATGILYFVIAGRFVLPHREREGATATSPIDYFRETYGVTYCLQEMWIPEDSPLVGRPLYDTERECRVRVVALKQEAGKVRIGVDSLSREVAFEGRAAIGILAEPEYNQRFRDRYRLVERSGFVAFDEALSAATSGIAEVVIPPGSALIGKSASDVWLRKTHGISMVALHRAGRTMREGEGIRDIPLQAGDTLVVHTPWDALTRVAKDRNFVVVTTEYPHEEIRPNKVPVALLIFAVTLGLILFTDLLLSVSLLTGAVCMILAGVLSIEEAYGAVSWKTVFLLASLIPLGAAVEASGTAAWIAGQTLSVLGDMPLWVIQAALAVLATFFTLVMSNVGATVLLVPLAVNIAIGVGADPAVYALTVAIATSNSFIIPTHQVNALIMGPGGYRVPDFLRAGGIMTVLFLVVSLLVLNLIF